MLLATSANNFLPPPSLTGYSPKNAGKVEMFTSYVHKPWDHLGIHLSS